MLNLADFLKRRGLVIGITASMVMTALLVMIMTMPKEDFPDVDFEPAAIGTKLVLLQHFLRAGLIALLGTGLVGLVVCFPLLFKADVNTKNERKNERRLRRIILYSYSVAALSLAASIVPFFFVPSALPGLYKIMLKNSVGVVLGCSEPNGQSDINGDLPPEIDCEKGAEQWVVNIGGMIRAPEGSNDMGSYEELPGSEAPWWPRARIHGGLVVPLYFLVLSLIGGAISLTRRVPEYHRRYSVHYAPSDDKPRLDRATVKEYLAFQITQFISAPLLAIVAYYILLPQQRSSLILLGFSVGFASEAILLMIRSLVEKLSPASHSRPHDGAASGVISDGSAGQPVVGATVGIVGRGTLRAQTDDKGYFIINGVPAGDQVLEAMFQAKKATTKITIDSGQTSVCHIALA